MPAKNACYLARPTLALSAVAILSLCLTQPACQDVRGVDAAGSAADSGPAQPGLFAASPEQRARLQVVPVRRASWTVDVHTTGTVDWDADRTTQAITQVNGPISRILVDLGSRVSAGDPLLYVYSPDVTNAIATYRKARNRESLAQRVVARNRELLERGALAGKDLESSEADYNDASTDVQNSMRALQIYGITKAEIERAETQGVAISPELAVRAPISGVIVQKLVSPGQVVQAGSTACFMISDVSRVWVQGHVFDRDLASIKPGDPAEESNPGFARNFRGKVAYIGASVDPATRTTPVRIVTENRDGLLKKDMFVDAVIRTGVRSNILVVPISAVLHDSENEPMVYVEEAPGRFARRLVTVGAQQDGAVEIRGGLREGEKVVSEGSLFIQFALTQ